MVSYLFSFLLALVGLVSIYSQNIELLKVIVFLLWINNVFYAFQDIKRNIVFLLFNLTFFTFLLGKPFAAVVSTTELLKKDIITTFSAGTQLHIYICLFISLLSLFWAYAIFSIKSKPFDQTSYINNPLIIAYRNASRKMTYFFFVFALIVNLEKMAFVLSVGYIDYYTDYHSNLPQIIHKLANFYTFSFYFYLMTMPTKKESRWPIYMFLFVGFSSLGYGQRNGLMLCLLMITLYYVIRQQIQVYGSDEKWITKRKVVFALVTTPFLLIFMTQFNSIRSNEEVTSFNSLWNNFIAFFDQQGFSVSIIGYEKDLHNYFPQDFPYSLGYFIDRFTNIELLRTLNVFPVYAPKSYELAMYGHNFGETITYLQDPNRYFAGGGLGSCYIAEMYHDFGYVGVVLISVFYALIFAKLTHYWGRNIWMSFCIFIILDRILYAPRADALGCFTEFLSSTFIVFVLVMFFVKRLHFRHSIR